MSIIPPQLQNQRFIKVDDSKRPIEKAWQQVGGANYPATDPEFMKWVETNRRYGILCGYPNNLVVIDFDDEITQREVLDEGLLPKTFSQKTARKGLLHLFYYTDDATSWKILDKDKNTLADIQGTSKQVIGPGTRIPDGREYQVVEDIPITTISSATLHKALDRFDYGKNQDALQQVSDGLTMDDFNKPQNNLNDKALQEVRSQLKIVDILRDAGISTARNPTKCPFHSSKGGKCLGFDNSKGIWNCFHCTEKGTAIDLWMKINNVTEFVDAKKKLCEKFGIKDTFVADKVAAENRERNTSNKPMVRLPQDSYTNTDFAEDLGQYFKGDESIFYKPDERNIVEITEYEDKLMRRQIIGFQAVDAKRLTGIIDDRVYTFTIKYNKDEEIEVIKSAKEQDISLLAKHHKFIGVLYKIKRFLTYPIPFLTRDAELIVPRHTPGKGYYDDRFQAYFTPETPELRIMGIDEAKSVIDDMLGEFCFKGDIDKVMAKAYIITPMCRGIYSRPTSRTPIFIIGANRERAGKDFLAGIRGILYEGQAIDDSPIVTGEKNESNNDELRKKLTSALKIGRRLYHSSNNRGYLNNAVFEQFATSEVWRDRELGKNNQLELSNEVDISLSANVGLTYTPDLHHRSRPINLFYSVENPNERIYRRSDLHGYILNNRSIILSAIYTLISSWVIAGMPSGKTPFTSFPEWARVVGGIMCYHNMGDPCINLDDVNIGGDRETQNMKEFCGFMGLHQLNDAEQPIGYTIGKLRAIVVEAQSREDIEGFSHWDLNERPDQVKFGNLIKRFVGREFHCKQQVKFMDKEGVEEWTKYKVTLRIAKDNDRSNKILYGFNTLIELNKEVPKPEVELSRAIKEETIGELSALSYDDAKDMLLSMCASNTEVSIDTIIDRGITEEQLTDFINHGIIFMSRAGFVRLL